MDCPVCAHANREGLAFCTNCGTELPDDVRAPQAPPERAPNVDASAHYTAEISRNHPMCFIFLIDQSKSMEGIIPGGEWQRSKAQAVAAAINRLLAELIQQSSADEEIIDRVCVTVIGYGSSTGAGPAFAGALAGQELIPISAISDNPLSFGPSGDPVWFTPVAAMGTPMGSAIRRATKVASRWIAAHGTDADFPPLVINITDGEADPDDQPDAPAAELSQLGTANGRLLFFNLHLSAYPGEPVMFPASVDGLGDPFAKQLFAMSSVLPPSMRRLAASEEFSVNENSRGFVYNADMVALLKFIDIGTRPHAGLR